MRLMPNIRVYDDLELMLDGERWISSTSRARPPIMPATARMALEAGAHVLVEEAALPCARRVRFLRAPPRARARADVRAPTGNTPRPTGSPTISSAQVGSAIRYLRSTACHRARRHRNRRERAVADGGGERGGILVDHGCTFST